MYLVSFNTSLLSTGRPAVVGSEQCTRVKNAEAYRGKKKKVKLPEIDAREYGRKCGALKNSYP